MPNSASSSSWTSERCIEVRSKNHPVLVEDPGGPPSRNSCHAVAGISARSAVARPLALQTTSGLKAGWRRVNSSRPTRSFDWNLPVFTSIAHLPQLPSKTPSTSSGFFAPVRDFLPRVPRVRQEAFSTHAPKRAGSPLLLAMPCGSMTATGALFSVTSFGGAALRRAARVEYLVSADWTYSNNYSIMT